VNLLLDTHALIWFVAGDRRLGRAARAAMEQEQARLLVSAASVWEMAIKAARGRLVLPYPVARYLADRIEEGYAVLRVDGSHAAAVEHLPCHHRDPFDRLLIAQALSERLPVITRDRVFKKYGVEAIW
jgi:PIN domain nuclease of toxin-antitoxin system